MAGKFSISPDEGMLGALLQLYGSRIPNHPMKGRILRSLTGFLFPREIQFVAIDGTRFSLPSREAFAQMFLWRRGYETDSIQACLAVLPSDGAVVDVGANFGLYTNILARHTSGRVVAVEPFPPNISQLETNLALNGDSNVTVCRVALGSTEGTVEIGCPDSSNPGLARALPGHVSSVRVPMRTLDCLLGELAIDRIALLKIDVEGAEVEVFKGLNLRGGHRPDHILMEYYAGARASDHALDHLLEAGYRARDVLGRHFDVDRRCDVPDHNLLLSG